MGTARTLCILCWNINTPGLCFRVNYNVLFCSRSILSWISKCVDRREIGSAWHVYKFAFCRSMNHSLTFLSCSYNNIPGHCFLMSIWHIHISFLYHLQKRIFDNRITFFYMNHFNLLKARTITPEHRWFYILILNSSFLCHKGTLVYTEQVVVTYKWAYSSLLSPS